MTLPAPETPLPLSAPTEAEKRAADLEAEEKSRDDATGNAPPNPKQSEDGVKAIKGQVDRQQAAVPGHGPKSKGSIG